MTTLTNAVSGQSQNCSGNLEISPGIGKHAIIPGHCRKKKVFQGVDTTPIGQDRKFKDLIELCSDEYIRLSKTSLFYMK